jgi:Rha family phage regulatory protein
MDELIILRRKEAVTTSLKVAEVFNKRHDNVLQSIQSLDCSDEFRLLNFKETFYTDEWNREQPMYYITRDGFTFLAMGYRGKKAAAFKEAYISAFNKMEKFITEKQSAEYLEARATGKLVRKEETDTIKKLVEYAKEQGSGHADMLYVTYTKLANKIVGINKRTDASTIQLSNLTFIERAIWHTIEDGMKLGMYYKEIYKSCKARMEQIKELACLSALEVS